MDLELRVLLLGTEAISPGLEGLLGASTVVLNSVLTSAKELDGRIAANLVLLAEVVLGSAVDFSNGEGSILVGLGELDPGGGKTLAVAAPRGEELHGKGLLGKLSLEGLGVEGEDGALLLLTLGLLLGLGLLLSLGLIASLQIVVDVLHVGLNSARDADVLRGSAVGEELDGGIATDTEARADILLSSAVDLTDVELVAGLLSELDPGGSETLAVATPRGEELDEPETLLGLLIESLGVKGNNLGSLLSERTNEARCKNGIPIANSSDVILF